MRNTLYSTLYSLLKKGDVERRTIFPDKVALYQKGEEKYKEGDGDWENPDLIENIKPEPHLVIFFTKTLYHKATIYMLRTS